MLSAILIPGVALLDGPQHRFFELLVFRVPDGPQSLVERLSGTSLAQDAGIALGAWSDSCRLMQG